MHTPHASLYYTSSTVYALPCTDSNVCAMHEMLIIKAPLDACLQVQCLCHVQLVFATNLQSMYAFECLKRQDMVTTNANFNVYFCIQRHIILC